MNFILLLAVSYGNLIGQCRDIELISPVLKNYNVYFWLTQCHEQLFEVVCTCVKNNQNIRCNITEGMH